MLINHGVKYDGGTGITKQNARLTHMLSLHEYSDMKLRWTVTTSNASVTFTVHSDTCEGMLPWFCFYPLHASCLHAGSTVATVLTTSFKSLKACISFKKFVCLLPVILRINSDSPPPKTSITD